MTLAERPCVVMMDSDIPDVPAQLRVRVVDDVELAVEQWGEEGTPILFLHATGFSRSMWRPACRLFRSRHPAYRLLALDMRGHGDSSKPPAPYDWTLFVSDLEALCERLGLRNLVICGHSVGGATAVSFAARRPELVSGLVLVEAALRPRDSGGGAGLKSDLIGRTERRRSHWDTRPQAVDYLRARSPYDSWDEATFIAWTMTGLRETVEGVALSCPPWVEASVFAEASDSRAWDELGRLQCPVWIGRGTGLRGLPSTTAPEAVTSVALAFERVAPGDGHFVPLERVAWTVGLLEEAVGYLERANLAS